MVLRRSTPAVAMMAALAGPCSAAAAPNTVRYRLEVELRAEATYTNAPNDTLRGRGRQTATYVAKTKRPFTIRRIRHRTGPRFAFTARVSGELTWRGSGFGGVGNTYGGCVFKWTEEVWPDKTAVSGWVTSTPASITRAGVLVTPDATGQIGTVTFDPNASCEREVVPMYPSHLTLLTIPRQLTDPVPLRKKFGQSFTVRYAPGAIPDRPNRVRPDAVTEEYDYAWTLRFTRSA